MPVAVHVDDVGVSCVLACDVDALACLRHQLRRCRVAALDCRAGETAMTWRLDLGRRHGDGGTQPVAVSALY